MIDSSGGSDSVSVRRLSHDTPRVLREVQDSGRIVTVTKHGSISALLIPTDVGELVEQWLSLRREYAAQISAVLGGSIDLDALSRASTEPTSAAPADVVSVGVKEFSESTAEFLRRAEEGDLVFLRRHGAIFALLVRCSLGDLVEMRIANDRELYGRLAQVGDIEPNDRNVADFDEVAVEQAAD